MARSKDGGWCFVTLTVPYECLRHHEISEISPPYFPLLFSFPSLYLSCGARLSVRRERATHSLS